MSGSRDDARPVFMIGIAAEMAGMHPQTLRMYERRGLVSPGRSKGHTRLYSQVDLARLGRIQSLSESGLNLAGIERVLGLERELERVISRVRELERELDASARDAARAADAARRAMSHEIVHVRHVGGPPAVRVAPVIPAGLRPVPRSVTVRDPRRSS
ncbi:MAG: MerR family transcriptional regulator [Thermoleophilia bacterium]